MKVALLALAPIIILLLGVSAIFSAAETALTGASRGRMHQLERDGDRAAARVNRLISDQETMIGAGLIGYNVLNRLPWRSPPCSSPRWCRAPGASPSPPA